jgi:hypothetical protein
MADIVIEAGGLQLVAQLDDSLTAKLIFEALPLSASVNTWGDEIYFEIPVEIEPAADARADVAVGDIGYWPPGNAFCVFFGPTPASSGSQPKAASPVNVFGRVIGDATRLRGVADGAAVRLSKAAD